MEALRKAYVLFVSIALLVLVIARPPVHWLGLLALTMTLVSVVLMVAEITGVRGWSWRGWWAWLGLLVVVDFAGLYVMSNALWEAVGWDWAWTGFAGLAVLLLPLFLSLYRLGRGEAAG